MPRTCYRGQQRETTLTLWKNDGVPYNDRHVDVVNPLASGQ